MRQCRSRKQDSCEIFTYPIGQWYAPPGPNAWISPEATGSKETVVSARTYGDFRPCQTMPFALN
jgi:hypothetical protein